MGVRLETLAEQSHTKFEQGQSRPQVMGEIAQKLDRGWGKEKRRGNGRQFLESLIESSVTIEGNLPEPLREKGDTIMGKEQPTLVEAVTETAKRLLFVDRLATNLPPSVMGIIVGGSLAYGPFYNLRGTPDASDLDVFYVVSQDFFVGDDPKKAISEQRGFTPESSEDFARRARIFPSLQAEDRASLLSVKSPVDDYLASIKVIPVDTFVEEFDTGLKAVIEDGADVALGIKDYKQGPYFASVYNQFSFLHEPYYFHMDEEYPSEGGAITNLPCIIMVDGHMHTGQHHNHLIPRAQIEYDRDGSTTKAMKQFRKHIYGRLQHEREVSEHPEQLELVNALDRKPLLSPQMLIYARKVFP